ncbi:membrane assembly protein AsmA [Mesorhizobium sp. Root157]|uniref:AsmA family protein n=1 Tax=Mesorhizobium sp. Root157 TaxID=1736477 RepID=UPI0006F339A4|nr:AsmA family protein [Mesorhizobium sp. Root157]KQZ79036.1 membrane assembly protein AsmA [Mesorhizobium sp. Root157]
MPSTWIRRGVWAAGFVVIVATLVFVALPFIASTRIVRDRIAWEMSAWSGYRVTIAGAPHIEVWPQFRAILTQVALSQWTDANERPVVAAERVEIGLSAMAALRGDVVFSSARLIRPTLRVERTAKGLYMPPLPEGGRINRSIDTARALLSADPANPDIGRLPADALGLLEFRDGRIVAAVNGKEEEIVTSLTGQANWSTLNSGASLSASGIWHGESVTLDAASAKPLLLAAGGPAPVTLNLKAAPANLSFEGTASLSANAYVDGQLKFSAPSLRRMLDWSGAGIAPGAAIGSVSISSKVAGSAGRVKFDSAEIVLDKNPGMGALDFAIAEGRPVISGTLAFETLDLVSFLSAFTPLSSPAGQVSGEIDPSFADRLNLDLRLSAARATAGAITLAEVAATAQVKNGLAAFDVSDAAAFGGHVQTSLRFDRNPGGTQVEMRLLASDINGGAFGEAAGMARLMPTGTGTVSIILKGPGKGWNSILENADGSISATFGPGSLTGLNLPAFLKRNSERGFFPLDDVDDGTVAIDGAELKASIAKGVVRIDKAQATSGKSRLWLTGIMPYAGRGLALSGGIAPTTPAAAPKDSESVAAANANQTQFFVGGSWSRPFISPITPAIPVE